MDICEQADRLDRKLEQLLLCMATCPTAESAQKRPVDGATGEGRLPHAPEGKRPPEGRGSF